MPARCRRSTRPAATDFTRVELAWTTCRSGCLTRQVTTEIDARGYLDAKLAAMRAHATQIAVDSPFFALSDNVGQRALRPRVLHAAGRRPRPAGPHGGREADLFAGIG